MTQPAGRSLTLRTSIPHPAADPSARRAELAAEARRLERRRAMARAVAARCRADEAPRGLDRSVATTVADRAARRAVLLHRQFHRTIDALVAADGFEEALRILRERAPRRVDDGGPIRRPSLGGRLRRWLSA